MVWYLDRMYRRKQKRFGPPNEYTDLYNNSNVNLSAKDTITKKRKRGVTQQYGALRQKKSTKYILSCLDLIIKVFFEFFL